MSDDYSDPSNPPASSGVVEPEIENAGLRISIYAHPPQIAEAIWNEIRQRISRKGEFIAVRSRGSDAGVAIFHLSAEDFSDDESVHVRASGIARDAAPLNFLICPAPFADAEAQRRMTDLFGKLNKDRVFLQVSGGNREGDAVSLGEEEFLLAQARDIANRLVQDPPPLSTVALAEFVSESNAARRDAKAGRKSRSSGKQSADRSPESSKASRKAGRKGDAVQADLFNAESSPAPGAAKKNPEIKAARKATKQSVKMERGSKKKSIVAGEAADITANVEKAADSNVTPRATKRLALKEKRLERKKEAVKSDAQSAVVAAGGEADAVKAARMAARRAAIAERKSRKSAAAAGTARPSEDNGPEAKAARKAIKKAEKSYKKAERRSKKKAAHLPGAVGNGDDASVADSEDAAKAARKAQKAALKAERKAKKREGNASPNETGAEKARRRSRRKAQDNDGIDASIARAFRITLDGLNEMSAVNLRRALERALADTPIDWPAAGEKSDLAIYAFGDRPVNPAEIAARAATIANHKAKMRIFLARFEPPTQEDDTSFAAETRAVAMLAGAFESALIQPAAKIRRYGAEAMLVDGKPGDDAYDLVAASILSASAGKFSKRKIARPMLPPPPDLIAARALARTPGELFSQLTWNDANAPKSLWTRASKESMEAFLDRKIELSDEQTLDIELPINWPAECPSRAAEGNVFGLDFLSGPLNYWYCKANGRASSQVKEVDAVLKGHNTTASEVLSYAGKIILDFAKKHPLSASVAWEENAVSRRTRVLALFVLCCKMASKRKVKFDEAVCTKVCELLFEAIEILRSDDLYVPCSFGGVEQDSLLVGLALVLRNTDYAERLLGDTLARLKTLQLDPGLTAEGVWRAGSFSEHCQLLSQFKTLLGDFYSEDAVLIEPIAAAAKKMAMFAEAVVKSDGTAPFFDDSRRKSYAKKLSGTRRALAEVGFSKNAPARSKTAIAPRLMETYVFREAQYFISHSMQKVSRESSLVLLHADPASLAQSDPGGVTLAFARGETDLLIRAELPEKTDEDSKIDSFDPALRNGYHINGSGFPADLEIKPNAAQLVKSWRGPGWAAAKSIDETNPAGSITRVVVHLKAVHTLIVVDELVAANGEDALFEQFWHFAPGLISQESAEVPLQFSVASGGRLSVAFDTQIPVVIEPEGEGSSLRRGMRLGSGIAATLFQWNDQSATVALAALEGFPGAWTLAASGNGFDVRLILSGDDLRYEASPAIELREP